MPTRTLPNDPSLENLKSQAKTLQRAARAEDPDAVAAVADLHPRRPEPASLKLADAQLVIARQYGFATWATLRRHVETVQRFTWRPEFGPTDDFVTLACLTYGHEDPARWERAAALVAGDRAIAASSIHAAAAAGDVDATRSLLAADPSLARAEGGAYNWEPLMYATYSRLPGADALGVARVLLDAGADPNVGYLWHGMPSPFTALTGAFGGGEDGQPWRPQWRELARLLLERGADANDSQVLYNRGLVPWGHDDADHIALLLEFGLGQGDGGVWHRRMGFTHPTPAQLLQDELANAAAGNRPRWARLVLDAGVDVDAIGTAHPTREGHTPWQLAARNGNDEVAAMIAAAGAASARASNAPLFEFLGACMRADRAALDMRVRDAAIALRPWHIATAADRGREDAVRLMAEVGFEVNTIELSWPHRTTALHRAAGNGDLAVVMALVELGADPTITDRSFGGTPLGWAEHGGHQAVADYLRSLSIA